VLGGLVLIGKAAVLKTAARKRLQVRVLCPPLSSHNNLDLFAPNADGFATREIGPALDPKRRGPGRSILVRSMSEVRWVAPPARSLHGTLSANGRRRRQENEPD
jgi:hypothetical protein